MFLTHAGKIIEIAGLSGSGKTTVCKTLSKRPGCTSQSCSPKLYRLLNKFYLDRFLLPVTVWKFQHVFEKMLSGRNEYNKKRYTNWIFILFLRALQTPKNPKTVYFDPTIDVLLIINRILLIYFLGRIESLLRNRCLVVDDGFIQRGLSLWLRVSPELRKEVVNTYCSATPSNIRCVVVDCGASEALRRVEKNRGLNTILRYTKESNYDPNYLNQQYQDMMQLLRNQVLEKELNVAKINPSNTQEEQADIVFNELCELKDGKKIIWWIF